MSSSYLGYIDSNAMANLLAVNTIKQDIADDAGQSIRRNQFGSTSITKFNKSKTSAEFDFVSNAQNADIMQSILATNWCKYFIRFPGYVPIDFKTATAPSSPNNIKFNSSSWTNTASPAYGIELDDTEYGQIGNIDSNFVFKVQDDPMTHAWYTFKFDISSLLDMNTTVFKRMTLMIHNPHAECNGTSLGVQIHAYNRGQGKWFELARQQYTIANNSFLATHHYQMNGVLRPMTGWTNVIDFGYGGNEIYFALVNNSAGDHTNAISIGFNYACLLIDGWPVAITNQPSFNYRGSFSGDYMLTGKLELSEL